MAQAGNWIAHGNDSVRLTATLAQMVQQLQAATDLALRLKGIMLQMKGDGSGLVTVEANFNLEAGLGGPVVDMIASLSEELATNGFIQGTLQRLG